MADRTAERVWFHLHPPHLHHWGPTAGIPLDTDLVDRFAAGTGAGDEPPPVIMVAPPPRPTGHLQRTYAGLAALTGPSARCLVGVSRRAAARVPWSAAGCGLLARRLPGPPTGARAVDLDRGRTIPPLPGWMVGTDVSGVPVTVNLVPGSTVLIAGDPDRTASATLPVTGRIDGDDISLISADGPEDTLTGWLAAWHPQVCRVLTSVRPASTVLAGTGPNVPVDLTIDLGGGTGAGELGCADTRIPFRRLPLR